MRGARWAMGARELAPQVTCLNSHAVPCIRVGTYAGSASEMGMRRVGSASDMGMRHADATCGCEQGLEALGIWHPPLEMQEEWDGLRALGQPTAASLLQDARSLPRIYLVWPESILFGPNVCVSFVSISRVLTIMCLEYGVCVE